MFCLFRYLFSFLLLFLDRRPAGSPTCSRLIYAPRWTQSRRGFPAKVHTESVFSKTKCLLSRLFPTSSVQRIRAAPQWLSLTPGTEGETFFPWWRSGYVDSGPSSPFGFTSRRASLLAPLFASSAAWRGAALGCALTHPAAVLFGPQRECDCAERKTRCAVLLVRLFGREKSVGPRPFFWSLSVGSRALTPEKTTRSCCKTPFFVTTLNN